MLKKYGASRRFLYKIKWFLFFFIHKNAIKKNTGSVWVFCDTRQTDGDVIPSHCWLPNLVRCTHYCKLDTPCTAGARSTPSFPNPIHVDHTSRHVTQQKVVSLCDFDGISCRVKYTDLHVITSKGFSTFSEKVTFWWSKKGTLDRPMLSLKARLGGSTFGIPKNRCVKLPLDSSRFPPPPIYRR